MTARPRLAALAAVPFLLLAAGAHADPAGKTTLEQTLAPSGGAYSTLAPAKGEKYTVRRGGSAKAARKRAARRRSLLDFAQLTDPQIADEMSPARVDFADPAGGELKSSWRPQEALGLQNFDSTVRNVNGNRRSPVKQGNGKKARLAFAITTGDLADNQQLNETRWFKTVLNGGTVDPFSGDPVTTQCGSVAPDVLARINADVAARRYTGVADYDDYRDAPQDRFAGFYDPDEAAPTAGPYAAFPRYPGLLGPLPLDRHGLPQGVPERPVRPAALRRPVRRRAVRRLRGPGVHPDADRGRQDRRARRRPPHHRQGRVPQARRARVLADAAEGAQGLARDRELLIVGAEEGLPVRLARHGRRGRRAERQHRQPAVQVAARRAAHRQAQAPDRDRLRPSHAGDDEQQAHGRGRGQVRRRWRAGLRPRPAQVDAPPPRHGGQEIDSRAVRRQPERGRLRGRPHPRQPRGLLQGPQGPRLLADQHGLAHRLAAAEPPDRGDGQPRRHAVAVRDGPRQRRPRRRARPRRRLGLLRGAARVAGPDAGRQRSPTRGARGVGERRAEDRPSRRPQRGAAGARPALGRRPPHQRQLQRDVPVLALRPRLALRQQRLERGDQLRPRLVRNQDVVDVAALGGRVRVGEARLVVVDQLGPPLLGRR